MSTKKMAMTIIVITLALGSGIAVFAMDRRGDDRCGNHHGCDFADYGHMNGSHYRHVGSNHNKNDDMSRYMDVG